MPEMDGFQTLIEIRKWNYHVPVIILTVDERQEIADPFLNEGASDFALITIGGMAVSKTITSFEINLNGLFN